MQFRTFASIKGEVQRALDLEEELFIQPQEYIDYCQKAIKFLEAEIHKLGLEDNYFEAYAPLSLAETVQDYALPSNIYSNKILRIVWRRNSEIFEIMRLTKKDRYTDIALMEMFQNTGMPYYYQILNNSPRVGPRIHLVPQCVDTVATYAKTIVTVNGSNVVTVADATNIAVWQFIEADGIPENTRVISISGLNVTLSEDAFASASSVSATFKDPDCLIYYIREANKIVGDTSVVDAFEFDDFVTQHMIVSCLGKEPGNPRLAIEGSRLNQLQDQMIATLTEMIPDQRGDLIEVDYELVRDIS